VAIPATGQEWAGPRETFQLYRASEISAMVIKATDLRRGTVIILDGQNWVVADFNHLTPGNWRAMVQTKLKNLSTGAIIERRFRSTETLETAYVERKDMEYLYSQGPDHYFMDTETYDQIPFREDILGNAMEYLKPNMRVEIMYAAGKPVSVEIPKTVDLQVTDTPPALKGATVTNQYKDATLETGLKLQVPPFIQPNDIIRVDTRTGEYLERAK